MPRVDSLEKTLMLGGIGGRKRRGRKEIEVTWGRKRRFKRGESNQASN